MDMISPEQSRAARGWRAGRAGGGLMPAFLAFVNDYDLYAGLPRHIAEAA